MRPAVLVSTHSAASLPAAALSAAERETRWDVRLLGAVEASDGVHQVVRFPSRAVAALLARLALAPDRAHAREELVDLLWPGVDLSVGRNRLRQVLSTLKSLLEPPGVPGAAVLQADRMSVRVVPGALGCDALRFQQLARAGQAQAAAALYRGEFMPGYFDEWVHDERQRLAALHERLGPAVLAAEGGAAVAPAQEIVATAPLERSGSAPLERSGSAPLERMGSAPLDAAPALARLPLPALAALAPPLPSYLTRLFGADMAVARVRSMVRAQRLVTLLGPGGSGKTRLAVEVVQALRDGSDGTLWPAAPVSPVFVRTAFVPLVACEQVPQMLAAMARALQLPSGGGDDTARLTGALGGQPVLLVLDNFEQLVATAQTALAALLSALPQLHLLVTSRRALGLDGEVLVTAEPLPLPLPDADLATAAASVAVALFADRARAVRADFHLGPRNRAAVVALVRALHGMPLAIELAASRLRSFAPAEMVALLDRESGAHLALLTRGGPRAGHDARHASMAQVIDWSWRLLDAPAQRLMAALSCFAGDATAPALAAVLGESTAQAAAQLDDLASHSLLRVVAAETAEPGLDRGLDRGLDQRAAHGETRFGLVEPVREFVRAQWPAADLAALRQAVQGWVLDWALALTPAAAPARVAAEMRNVHAVLATADTAPETALRLALALRGYWDTEGLPAALQTALEKALALHVEQGLAAVGQQTKKHTRKPAREQEREPERQPDRPLASAAHELLAYLRFEAGFAPQALVHADAALAAAGSDASLRARALVRRAWVEIAAGRAVDSPTPQTARQQAWLHEALALAQSCGDREAQARALHQMAVIASHVQADWAGSEALLAQSQALWLALGDRRKAFARLRNRAQCWFWMGRHEDAQQCFELCERTAREEGDAVGQIDSLLSLSSLLLVRRQWAAALELDRRCVALCWQRWHRHGLGYALWNPPRALARLRRPEPAMQLMGFAATFWQANFGPLARSDRQTLRRVRGLVVAQVGAARADALWAEGAAMDVSQAVALALQA